MVVPPRLVRSGDLALAVYEHGDPTRPTVVLVHGYPDTHAVWDGVVAELAAAHHVVTYDVRGAGASQAPRERSGYQVAALAADLRAVIEAVSPQQPVHVVGHDWGSTQAWEAVTEPGAHARIASFTSISGPSLDHLGYWTRRRLARPTPRHLGQLVGQLVRSWYIAAFQVPVLPQLVVRRVMVRWWAAFLARVEGVAPRPGHPAPTLADDAVNGIELYRANLLRPRPPRERRTEIPVQIIQPSGDRYVTAALLDESGHWVPRLWRRSVRAGHWVPLTHAADIAGMVSELVAQAAGAEPSPALAAAWVGEWSGPPAVAWYQHPTPAAPGVGPAPDGQVAAFHQSLPGYVPTPLVELPELARELGVGRVFVKDESARLGLGAFKVLGASWAVYRRLDGSPQPDLWPAQPPDLEALRARLATAPPVCLVAATDGNHGAAVAWMARLLGLRSRVFVPDVVPDGAVAALRAQGAAVTVVAGSYDDAVRRAAAEPGILIQDTAWPGYEAVPGWIVDGYSTLFAELRAQLPVPAGLLVVPMGVGALAQAAIAHGSWPVLGVEPQGAACVLASLLAGRLRTVSTGATVMAGLNCGTPSAAAWPVLRDGLAAAVAVPDGAASRAAGDLAGLGVDSGPSGAASLAGARAALTDAGRRAALGVDTTTVVVLLSTEGSR